MPHTQKSPGFRGPSNAAVAMEPTPAYAAETHRQRSAAHQERRMHGEAIRQVTDQQKLDARRKVRDMLRRQSLGTSRRRRCAPTRKSRWRYGARRRL